MNHRRVSYFFLAATLLIASGRGSGIQEKPKKTMGWLLHPRGVR